MTQFGRALLIERMLKKGWSAAATADAAGVARATVYKWLRRYQCEGDPGQRHSPPSGSPHHAVTSAHAVLNYLYAVAETEVTIAATAAGGFGNGGALIDFSARRGKSPGIYILLG